MSTPRDIKNQIIAIISKTVELGIASDQNFPVLRELGRGRVEITMSGAEHLGMALHGKPYAELYDDFLSARVFTLLLVDGAMLQMNYEFLNGELERSRLAFLPSPHLADFQTQPEVYLEDAMYAEVVSEGIVPFPLRFDYDARDNVYQELLHPISHLSLGQYENCRIPVTSPLPPGHFCDFILRNLYNTAHQAYSDRLPRTENDFPACIFTSEEALIHIRIPRSIHR